MVEGRREGGGEGSEGGSKAKRELASEGKKEEKSKEISRGKREEYRTVTDRENHTWTYSTRKYKTVQVKLLYTFQVYRTMYTFQVNCTLYTVQSKCTL